MAYSQKIKDFADAIKVEEGWFPGSRSFRNNNCGNLKFAPLIKELGATHGDPDNFAVFPDYENGYDALCEFLTLGCEDSLKDYHQARTLRQFIQIYARPPASHPYAENVAKKLGVYPDVNIAAFLEKPALVPAPIPPFAPPPYVQKILVIQNGVIAEKAAFLSEDWFEKLGIPTTTEIVNDSSSFGFVTLPGILAPAPNPEEIKVIASRYVKDHHFVLFCYPREGTFLEFSELFLGANLVYIPILFISTPEYTCAYMVHEILHGWYARLAYNGLQMPDNVHNASFTDTRPEANYSAIVEKLKPHASVIFRPITVPEKINFLRKAIDGFIALLNSFFKGRKP